jgi:hypothetical protein
MFRNTTSKFTLRQLQVLHRHGDRTPLHNVFKGKAAQALEEEKRWKKQLPTIESIQCLREKYPILHTKTSNTSSDIQINPTGKTSTSWEQAFGNLTQTGLNQMEARGKQLVSSKCKVNFISLLNYAFYRQLFVEKSNLI